MITLEQVRVLRERFTDLVKYGEYVALWDIGNVPKFIRLGVWDGKGVKLSMDQLEELFDHAEKVANYRWN